MVDIATVGVLHPRNKAKGQKEFDRRRLKMPLTVAPGQKAERSLSFPMAPGPQRLILNGRAGDAPLEMVLELKPLAGLHLKPAEKKWDNLRQSCPRITRKTESMSSVCSVYSVVNRLSGFGRPGERYSMRSIRTMRTSFAAWSTHQVSSRSPDSFTS